MKLLNKTLLLTLLFIFSSTLCMEEQPTLKSAEVTPSKYLSFVEALLGGGQFCVDINKNTLEFKHFKKSKRFIYPIAALDALTGTSDIFSIKEKSDYNHLTLTKSCNLIKKVMLMVQLKRLCSFNNDPFFGETKKYTSQKFMLKKLTEHYALTQRPLDGCSNLHCHFTTVTEEHAPACAATLATRNKNRQELRQALLEKDSLKITEACPKLLCLDYNSLVLDAEVKQHLDEYEEQCTLRKSFATKKYPHLKYFISFTDTIFQGHKFNVDHENQTVQFKHFKNNTMLTASLFVTLEKTHCLFDEDPTKKGIEKLLSYFDHAILSQKILVQRLSLLKYRQRKLFVTALRVIRFFERPHGFTSKRSEIKSIIEKMLPEQRALLDGFNTIYNQIKGSEKKKLHVYAGKVAQKLKNQNIWRKTFNEKNVASLAECTAPLALEFVPFQEEFDQLEIEVKKLKNKGL